MPTKQCRKCGESKPYADFPKGRDSNGLYYICKTCIIKRTQTRYRTMDKLQRWVDATFSDVKGRAKRRDIPFTLTKELYYEMYATQQGKCVYCTVEFDLTNTRHARRTSPSTDRLIPSGGYTPDNVVLCCHRCNAIKNDASLEELQQLTETLAKLLTALPEQVE